MVSIKKNPTCKAKYEACATAYQVGTTLTFAAPTSFSIAAGVFCDGIQFVVPDGAGTKLHELSAFDSEGEVVVDGPSSWVVPASTMTPTGTLVVILKRVPTLTCLTQDDDQFLNANPPAMSPAFSSFSSDLFPLVAPKPAHALAAPSPSPHLALSVKQVAPLPQSVRPAFSEYSRAVAQHDFNGVFLAEATGEELSDMFKA